MADDLTTAGTAPEPTPPGATLSPEPQLPILRFGLRQLFWFLTLACLVLASVVAAPTPGVARLAVLLVVLVVGLHVVATALGSRLREHADERLAWQAARDTATEKAFRSRAPVATSRSPWHQRSQPMRWRWWLVGAGAAAGGIAGTVVFLSGDKLAPSPAAIAFGAISMAVVGGWFAFLGSHFWVMLRHGWRDALAEGRKDEARRGPKP